MTSPTRRTLLVALPVGIVIGAAGALAADPQLDEADSHIDKAIKALKNAYSPKHKNEFGGHGKRAVELLEEAKKEIRKAKVYDDSHPKEDTPAPKPTASGPGPKPTSSGPGPKPPGPGPKPPGPGPKPPGPGPKPQ